MELSTLKRGNVLELQIRGELDNYWAGHLSEKLQELIRGESHRILVDLSAVSYLSSAGIGVLVKYHRQLHGLSGFLSVTRPSDPVREVLALTKLDQILIAEVDPVGPASIGIREHRHRGADEISYKVYEQHPGAVLKSTGIGAPELFASGCFTDRECRAVSMPPNVFAIGLGGFGVSFADCRDRVGEFIAVGGAAAYLPTHANLVPDYQVASGEFVPEMQVLYGLACEGRCARLIRFEASAESDSGTVGLTTLASVALEVAGADVAGIVVAAEVAGLVGASLRRSPASESASAERFGFPQIRQWLSFTPEPAYARSMALVAGVVSWRNVPGLDALLRPLGQSEDPIGHLHAAVFGYQPLRKGDIDLEATVAGLYEPAGPQAVLHLLSDSRSTQGAGQSQFLRGACWVGPIDVPSRRKQGDRA
jgi:anti-anti-sigma factor